MEEVYTNKELAQIMGVSEQTVVSWKENNQVPAKAITWEGTFIKSVIDPFIEIYKHTPPSTPNPNQYTQTMPAKKTKKKSVTKKGYPVKTRNEAMRLIFEEKLSMKEVAAQIGCSVNSLQTWKKHYKPEKSESPVRKTTVQPKASQSQPKNSVTTSQIAFDDFVRNYWNEGTKAVDVLLLPQEISSDIVRYVNEALQYAYDQFRR